MIGELEVSKCLKIVIGIQVVWLQGLNATLYYLCMGKRIIK